MRLLRERLLGDGHSWIHYNRCLFNPINLGGLAMYTNLFPKTEFLDILLVSQRPLLVTALLCCCLTFKESVSWLFPRSDKLA